MLARSSDIIAIDVTALGDYVRLGACDRQFRLNVADRELKDGIRPDGKNASRLQFFAARYSPMDLVLRSSGLEAETRWAAELETAGLTRLTLGDLPDGALDARRYEAAQSLFRRLLADLPPGQDAFLREVPFRAEIGAFYITGRVDFLLVIWRDGRPTLRIVEGKASRKDKSYHRIQIATYRAMLRRLFAGGLTIGGITIEPDEFEFAIVRIDEETNAKQSILAAPILALTDELPDVERMLRRGGRLHAITAKDQSELPFCIEAKCDDCRFDVVCMLEAARTRQIEIIGLSPSCTSVLQAHGIDTIDALATLDPASDVGRRIAADDNFDRPLRQAILQARARRGTLPPAPDDVQNWPVALLPHSGPGQLPCHLQKDGSRLIRVHLEVCYDYVDNRIAALAAHVTSSDWTYETPWKNGERDPGIGERGPKDELSMEDDWRPIQGTTIVRMREKRWSPVYEEACREEAELIESFFSDLVEGICAETTAPTAPVHFYVYRRSDVTRLIEACKRSGDAALSALHHLLGCREGTEQMIFSCIQDEISARFAMGWTGRALVVTAALSWFGQRHHWRRTIAGESVNLGSLFRQDIFDFLGAQRLHEGEWTDDETLGERHIFEVHSRQYDALSAPYWHALWGDLAEPELPEGANDKQRLQFARALAAYQKYKAAGTSDAVRCYLEARVLALRWLEERIGFDSTTRDGGKERRNSRIDKPHFDLASLRRFAISETGVTQSAINFMTLDQRVRLNDWIAAHLSPPGPRVRTGSTLPVRNITVTDKGRLVAEFDFEPFGADPDKVRNRTSFAEGGFARLSPRPPSPDAGQSDGALRLAGSTCAIEAVDWDARKVTLAPIPKLNDDRRYALASRIWSTKEALPFSEGTLDESISDFVAGHVEGRLSAHSHCPAAAWLDPHEPAIPPLPDLTPDKADGLARLLGAWRVPGTTTGLDPAQADAIAQGLNARLHLLKGPPGTGKTATTAVAVNAKAAFRLQPGATILIGASTHRAIVEVLRKLAEYRNPIDAVFRQIGLQAPDLKIARVLGRGETPREPTPPGVETIAAESPSRKLTSMRAGGVAVLAGTTATLLKMTKALEKTETYKSFTADALVVDEASMMVFPHFLALASLVGKDGTVMLAGDDRQLAPIVAHDWADEDRPPSVYYQPHRSAYAAVEALRAHPAMDTKRIVLTPLTYTFRLPADVRRLVSNTYRQDGIALRGRDSKLCVVAGLGGLADILSMPHEVILVLHSEDKSRKHNPFEARLVAEILKRPQPAGSVALVTPHRAQRAFLRATLDAQALAACDVIDTVERLQGGERSTVIVSAAESDPHTISGAAEFILNLNRANVAFSRAQSKLIVVCAETLLDHVPADLDHYKSATLWKALRSQCDRQLLDVTLEGHRVRVLAP